GNTARTGRLRARSLAAANCRPRLELLEERITPDAGDTLNLAVATGLGPTAGSYAVASEHVGDGSYTTKDVDLYQINVNANQFLRARTSLTVGGSSMDTILELFDSSG